jgi:hypothetical protein
MLVGYDQERITADGEGRRVRGKLGFKREEGPSCP